MELVTYLKLIEVFQNIDREDPTTWILDDRILRNDIFKTVSKHTSVDIRIVVETRGGY